MVKDKNFAIRLPHIDDLIGLKKIGERPKDLEDIEYLKALKKELKIYLIWRRGWDSNPRSPKG
jgi:hypothetical protein